MFLSPKHSLFKRNTFRARDVIYSLVLFTFYTYLLGFVKNFIGTIDAKGHLTENTRILNSDGMGKDFRFAVAPWVVTSFSRHDTIPPKGHQDLSYGINVPQGGGKITLEAKLRYRQADQGVAGVLLGAVPESINLKETYGFTEVPPLPVVDMVVKQISFDSTK